MWINSAPQRAKRKRPKEKGPSIAPSTDPISTGVTEAVNENGRVASIQICTRLGPAPAVRACPDAIYCYLRRYYEGPLTRESKGERDDCGLDDPNNSSTPR